MANTHELSTQSEGSDQGSYSDDFERDPDFEETESKFSSLSLSLPRHKPKSSDVVVTNPEETEINDENFERVQSLIKVGMVERLKVEECKLYLRKNCLRLSGNKDVLIQRIKEHLEIINGGGERKYPPSSFVLDCKGDACTGDVVLFEQNVYEMFNIASRSASGPSCGKRTVAGRIVKESYGTAKQQHTFTIEVLWSKGEKPFPSLHPLLIKGRNLYRLKTLRQKWEDEGERQKILREKHSRGSIARADREARVQEKQEKVNRKTIMENRVSRRKCSVINHPEETDTSIDEKPLFPSALTTNIRNKMSVNKPPGVTEPWGKLDSSRTSNETTPFVVSHTSDQKYWKCSSHHISEAQLGDFHSREREKYQYQYQPHNSERNRFGVNHINNQKDWKHSYYHISEAQLGDFHSKESEQYQYHPLNSERNSFAHTKPLTSANHSPPLPNNREMYKQKQLCRYYARGRCYFGDNCKFVHDSRGV